MTHPDIPEDIPEGTPHSHARKQPTEIISATRALVFNIDSVESDIDKRIIAAAIAFLDAPTEDLSDIRKHAEAVGEVMSGYFMNGSEPPQEIDELNGRLQILLCMYYVNLAKRLIAEKSDDLEAVQFAMRFALDIARTYIKGYPNNAVFQEAIGMQLRIEDKK